MFHTLRTRLTILYGGLFAAMLAVIALAVGAAVGGAAQTNARQELLTSAQVFERVWALREAQLENGAGLQSRDFGFREAVASHDADTIRSALDNLQGRLGSDLSLLIGLDGTVVAGSGAPLSLITPRVRRALQSDEVASGVLELGGLPYEVVSVPIAAPTTLGWVVFAAKLDRAQMKSLERLAAAPLNATIVRLGGGRGSPDQALVRAALASGGLAPRALSAPGGSAMVLAHPLRSLDPRERLVLLLRYPMALALAPYRLLMALLAAIAVAGLAGVLAGAFALARTVTAPLSALKAAAARMQAGELARVESTTRDEVGELALAFNRMVEEIGARDAERDRHTEALARAKDDAEAANRAKSTFLANMSHEVRTPLNGVLGVAGVLARSRLSRAQRQMVGVIESSASALLRVLGDVLDLAWIEAGRMEISRAAFDLAASLARVAAPAEDQARAKGLGFALDLSADLPARVTGDPARLEQILANLVGNAVKFTPQGEVRLSVRRAGAEGLAFDVADTGVGFEDGLAEQLFRPFRQADGSMTRRFGGNGLGLSISRELARAMGGDITARAAPGAGATFSLVLPLPEARDGEAASAPAPGLEESETPLRVLLADDHETNRMVVRLILEAIGAELTEAEDGRQAVDAFAADRFDVVLMDLQMPVMDGLAAIGEIRRFETTLGWARTPILVVSANAMPEHVEASARVGADGHLAKPITPPSLIAALERAISQAAQAEAA